MQNTTGLSFAGVIKWLFIIGSIPCFIKAYQGVIVRKTSGGYGRFGSADIQLITGDEAVKFGLQNLGLAFASLAIAWAVWYFWQQHEE